MFEDTMFSLFHILTQSHQLLLNKNKYLFNEQVMLFWNDVNKNELLVWNQSGIRMLYSAVKIFVSGTGKWLSTELAEDSTLLSVPY